MTALADLLSPRERQLLAGRLAELREVEQLHFALCDDCYPEGAGGPE
jgi:hypothetical protein